MSLPRTPSQTVGPFFEFALCARPRRPSSSAADAAGAIRIEGRVLDGAGAPVPDALVEIWQADAAGRYDGGVRLGPLRRPTPTAASRSRPSSRAPCASRTAASRRRTSSVLCFARGLLKPVLTRIYFADEAEANAADPVLRAIADDGERATLIAGRAAAAAATASTSGCRATARPSSSRLRRPGCDVLAPRRPRRAPVVVLSNSLGTTLAMWDPQMPALTEHFTVLRYDHPGHGRGSRRGPVSSVEGLARGVLEILDGRGIERVSFCGLSLGGAVGQWLAMNAPERIDRLVLACASARFGTRESWRARIDTVRAGGIEAVADAVLALWFTPRDASRATPGARARLPRDDGLGRARGLRGLLRGARRLGPGDELAGDPRADARARRAARTRHAARAGRGDPAAHPGAR